MHIAFSFQINCELKFVPNLMLILKFTYLFFEILLSDEEPSRSDNRKKPANETIQISSSNESIVDVAPAFTTNQEDIEDEEEAKRIREQLAIELKARAEFKRILSAERFAKRRMKLFYPERHSKRRLKAYKDEFKRQKFLSNEPAVATNVVNDNDVQHPTHQELSIGRNVEVAAANLRENAENQPTVPKKSKGKGKGKGKSSSSRNSSKPNSVIIEEAAISVSDETDLEKSSRKKKSKKRKRSKPPVESSDENLFSSDENERKRSKRKKKKSKRKHSTDSRRSSNPKKKKRINIYSSISSDDEMPLASRWKVSIKKPKKKNIISPKSSEEEDEVDTKVISIESTPNSEDLRLKLRRSRIEKRRSLKLSSTSDNDSDVKVKRKMKSVVFKVVKNSSSSDSVDDPIFDD